MLPSFLFLDHFIPSGLMGKMLEPATYGRRPHPPLDESPHRRDPCEHLGVQCLAQENPDSVLIDE